jgi:hypothetical protein
MTVRSALLAVMALALGAVASAGTAEPQGLPPLKMSMDYDGTLYPLNLLPVKVLVVHATGRQMQGGYGADVSMKSYGILRALKRVDIDATTEGHVGQDGQPYPASFTYVHHDGKRVRHVHVDWSASDVQVVSTPAYGDLGHPAATRAQKLAATDPLTQFVRVAVAAGPQAICHGPDRFFDGKQLYQLEFGRVEPAALTGQERALGISRVAQCTVRYVEVAGFKPKPPDQRTQGLTSPITMVFGQVGDSGPWVIVDIHANTVIGFANIVLRSISVTPSRAKA